jgi:hypothetical protein
MTNALSSTLAIAVLAAPVAGCAHDEAAPSSAIVDYSADTHEQAVAEARYEIIIHSGAGIPGSPGAGDYYRRPREVLQAIVDTCALGSSIYIQATDGVSVLAIVNPDLTDEQVACVRSAEDNGLRFTDKGTRRSDEAVRE